MNTSNVTQLFGNAASPSPDREDYRYVQEMLDATRGDLREAAKTLSNIIDHNPELAELAAKLSRDLSAISEIKIGELLTMNFNGMNGVDA